MVEVIDQVFVSLKHWALGFVPAPGRSLASALLSVLPLFVVFPLLFAITTVLERKIFGRIQNRYGPNRVGPFGFLQFVADGLKALTKEDFVPRAADRGIHFLAPVLILVPAFLALGVLPCGRNLVAFDHDAGVLFLLAVGATTELAVFMAGWSSRNKYSLLGAMRAIAQMISYEVPLILSALTAVMAAGSLRPSAIVLAQSGYSGWLPHWFVLTPWGLAGFVLFMIAAMAEANRSPFDIPEGESEIVAGYFLEYSGFKFAMFFMAEYLGMFAISGLGITLFLGGWNAPLPFLTWIPSWFWFFAKLMALVFGFIWARATLPRLRVDQLMNFAWKFMLPMALVNLVGTGLWRFLEPGLTRWLVCGAIVGVPYVVLGRALTAAAGRSRRTYRYAD